MGGWVGLVVIGVLVGLVGFVRQVGLVGRGERLRLSELQELGLWDEWEWCCGETSGMRV